MKKTIETQTSRTETETAVLHAIRDFIEDESAQYLTINLDSQAFNDGVVKVSTTDNRFNRSQVVEFTLSLRRKAIDHGTHPMGARMLREMDTEEQTAWVATNAQLVVKGKVVNVCALGLKGYHDAVKSRRAEDQALATQQACEQIGMAFRAVRKDNTFIMNGETDLWYDIDLAIKAVCRDLWGSQWWKTGATAQNKARKDEAATYIEVINL